MLSADKFSGHENVIGGVIYLELECDLVCGGAKVVMQGLFCCSDCSQQHQHIVVIIAINKTEIMGMVMLRITSTCFW